MKPLWIIEDFTNDNNYKELIAEVKNQNLECVVLNSWCAYELKYKPENRCIIFNGSIQLGLKLKEELKTCWPIVWLTEENYLCSKYYPRFGDLLFNDKYIILPASELMRQKWDVYSKYGKEACIFVRPDNGLKSFAGQVIDLKDFDSVFEQNLQYGMKSDELVIISTPKNIIGEWRFICSEEKIIAVSSYKFHGLDTKIPSAPIKATNLVDKILKRGNMPDKVFSVDICQGQDEEFYLLEFNAFSTCGTYACNKKAIIEEVTKIACL